MKCKHHSCFWILWHLVVVCICHNYHKLNIKIQHPQYLLLLLFVVVAAAAAACNIPYHRSVSHVYKFAAAVDVDFAATTLSLHFNGHFTSGPGRYQNVLILDFIGAKDDGGGANNWSYKSCKAPVKMSPPTNQHPVFYRPDALPVTQPTVSKH